MSQLREKANKAKEYRCKNLIIVLENPKTIENIGSVLRNIDALGAQKLYVIDGYNLLPKSWDRMRDKHKLLKISASAVKWVYVKRYEDTQSCIDYLNQKGFISISTSPHVKGKKNVILEKAKFTDSKVAIWFGNESKGISSTAIEHSKLCVQIPMAGIIESLNLGTSTGIVIYEATKQRRKFRAEKRKKKV